MGADAGMVEAVAVAVAVDATEQASGLNVDDASGLRPR